MSDSILDQLIEENETRRRLQAEQDRDMADTAQEVSGRAILDPEEVKARDRQKQEELDRLRDQLRELGVIQDDDSDDDSADDSPEESSPEESSPEESSPDDDDGADDE